MQLYGFPDDDDLPPLVGTVVESTEMELTIAWGDGATRHYRYPNVLMAVENLEKLS